jgi:predicted dehydrogenase
MPVKIPQVAIAGMGGFAIQHHDAVFQLEREGKLRLRATCDPSPERRASLPRMQFEARGVEVFDSLETTLNECASELDIMALATPIEFHSAMHQACVAAGVACYLEKPPTLYWGEYQQMLAHEASAQSPTFVGFNFQSDPVRLMLRERISRGEFGALKELRFDGSWPRPESYFRRNTWAGKLMVGDYPVMDSVTGNAMAHFMQNMFHWAGVMEGRKVAKLASVESKLWRVNEIESFDTLLSRVITEGGVEIRIAATHGSSEQNHNLETVVCEQATIYYDALGGYTIVREGRATEAGQFLREAFLTRNYQEYLACLSEAREPCNTLDACASFVLFSGLNLVSAGGIGALDYQVGAPSAPGEAIRHSPEFAGMARCFLREGQFPEDGLPSERVGPEAIDLLDAKLKSLRFNEEKNGSLSPKN